ncbi:TSC22 domain family protein 4-like, partial [Plectropomus leopardus]|uniref:TSC22 domain family protein 4-like n=1 Tax=Plectropomus leopardus TaxID=160734 RepID=UPI001C4D49CB
MLDGVKKMILGRRSSPLSDPALCPRSQRRPPSTPPLPTRKLQLVAKQPEVHVVFRDRRKVKGQVTGVRESWPGTGRTPSEPKPRTSQRSLTPPTNLPRPQVNPPAPHPHWSVPIRAPPTWSGSDATMMSLLLLCHSGSSHSLVAIDNKIEQAMDLVKSHLMLAVREEVELLREQIRELQERNQQLERENHILR